MKLKLLVAAAISIAVGCLVPCVVGFAGTVKVLGSLARVSIALFGVFGVWLGLSYRDEIVTGLWRDNSDVKTQRLKANLIKESYLRCVSLFRGFYIAAFVFVISWFGEIMLPLFSGVIDWTGFAHGMIVRRVLLIGLDAAIFGMIIAEIYAVIMSVWPVRYITKELKEAAKSADIVLMETREAE